MIKQYFSIVKDSLMILRGPYNAPNFMTNIKFIIFLIGLYQQEDNTWLLNYDIYNNPAICHISIANHNTLSATKEEPIIHTQN